MAWFTRKPEPAPDTEKMRALARQICGMSLSGEYDGDFYRDTKRFLRAAADELDKARAAHGESPS